MNSTSRLVHQLSPICKNRLFSDSTNRCTSRLVHHLVQSVNGTSRLVHKNCWRLEQFSTVLCSFCPLLFLFLFVFGSLQPVDARQRDCTIGIWENQSKRPKRGSFHFPNPASLFDSHFIPLHFYPLSPKRPDYRINSVLRWFASMKPGNIQLIKRQKANKRIRSVQPPFFQEICNTFGQPSDMLKCYIHHFHPSSNIPGLADELAKQGFELLRKSFTR